uniref:uncharacterized protein LOC122602046 n=1 Tax=Erigeron canadensis TaxID=72917 RepID=UPI001CB97DD7|nr:uncharacterized protein LOC122602046 [Erigeron canadensis]
MIWMILRRSIVFKEVTNYHFRHSKQIRAAVHNQTKTARDFLNGPKSGPDYLFSKFGDQSNDYKIDIVDDETWQVSTGFADMLKNTDISREGPNSAAHDRNLKDPDDGFDDIDDLRICGKLFYKLDKDSKEYEEYNYDFHRRKKTPKTKTRERIDSKKNDVIREEKKMNATPQNKFKKKETLIEKKQRVPTFNQVTAPYHEPFCLDIYISKASVRACIVHRATSKVVVVAHSISKDMKFDLGSTRNVAACQAVGKVLAQRALADDIHNVVYTPKKGEKIEGKLQSVLQCLMKNGVHVKVKIKQKKGRKSGF